MSTDELAQLIARTALADRAAFRLLYQRTSPKLFGICLRILRDRGEAEDALQEVYVKIWQNAPKFSAMGYSPITWLAAIARNHAIDRIRSRRPQAMDIDEAFDLADEKPTPEQNVANSSEKSRIDRCLDQLKPDRAEAVRSAYVEGFSYEELAARYKVPLNTLRTWLRRSLLSLQECLGQ